jgi:hypothetical protein
VWIDSDGALMTAAREIPTATVVDAGRAIDVVEHDVRHWIDTRLHLTRHRGVQRGDKG